MGRRTPALPFSRGRGNPSLLFLPPRRGKVRMGVMGGGAGDDTAAEVYVCSGGALVPTRHSEERSDVRISLQELAGVGGGILFSLPPRRGKVRMGVTGVGMSSRVCGNGRLVWLALGVSATGFLRRAESTAFLRMTVRVCRGKSHPHPRHPHLNLPPSRGKRPERRRSSE